MSHLTVNNILMAIYRHWFPRKQGYKQTNNNNNNNNKAHFNA